ncbi:MAG: glycosyltransferase [Candidatus Levybacteria bacterium]|nr:glycosyltransferase [Candidatus Levybacteria bacterium]
MEIYNENDSIIFATFSPYRKGKRDPKNGNVEPFISFFSKKFKRLTLIDQPHTGSDTVAPVIEEYVDGKLKKKYNLENKFYNFFYWLIKLFNPTDDDTNIFYKLRDLISVIHVGFKHRSKVNYFVGLESVNTLAGFILKKIGKVERTIYYVSDYSPSRYDNKLFNWLYLGMDRFCCYNSNYIWDVSKVMQPARIKAGLSAEKSAPAIHVPNALFPEFIKHLSIKELIPYSLVFMGSLGPENGPDLAVLTLPYVVKKFPKVHLYIIGGREKDILRLKTLAMNLKVEKYVTFYGMIPDDLEMLSILRKCYLALAPYLRQKNSVRWFGDSLKLRAYMACGLPVITTQVPPLGRELKAFGSALIAKDNEIDLAGSIIKMFTDERLYKQCRNRAIEFGKSNTWENTFNSALLKMNEYEQN